MNKGLLINIEKHHIKVTPKIKVTLSRESKVENTYSILYALGKKMKNNACKLASAKVSISDTVDILAISNLKIKEKKSGKFVIDTSERTISCSLTKLRKYLFSSDYKVKSETSLLIMINENLVSTIPISSVIDITYSQKDIEELVRNEYNRYQSTFKFRTTSTP